MGVVRVGRRHRQGVVHPGQKLGFQIVVGLLHGLHFSHPHPLHQPVLRGLKSALHAPFRLRTVRRDPGNPQLLPYVEGIRFRVTRNKIPVTTLHKILRKRIYMGEFDYAGHI